MSHKFHGISLANNSTADNFHFERVASTPASLREGRIWFNTTDKTFCFSSLTAGGAVSVNVFATQADLVAGIAALQSALDTEVLVRQAGDDAEVAARIAAVNTLTAALAQEVSDRTTADATEAQDRITGLATEAQQRTDAIAVAAATAANATATETASRIAGDAAQGVRTDAVQAELDASQVGAGLNVDGTFTAPANTVYLGTATSLKDADVKLDTALAAEAATRLGQFAALSSGLANETQLREDGDANLQTQLTAYITAQIGAVTVAEGAESAARIAGDAALQAELDRTQATIGTDTNGNLIPITGTHYLDEVTTVFGGAFVLDTQIYNTQQALAAETAARTTADTNQTDALNTETTNRTAAVAGVQAELDTTQAGAGLETDGTYVAGTDTNYLNAATSLKDADHKLDAAAKAISNRVTAIETVSVPQLQTQITTELERATAAETTEAAARAAGDADNAAAILTEKNDRIAAVADVTTALSSAVTTLNSTDAGLQTQINTLVASSGEGAAALKTELNANRYQYESTAPALVHTVTHNMNTKFYSCEVRVQGVDGVWRNDIVPVEDTNMNEFVITLTESSNVRASGQSNAALA